MEEYKNPFYNEGREEGRLEQAKSSLLRAINRFTTSPSSSKEVCEIIESIEDLKMFEIITDIEIIEKIIRKHCVK